MRDHAKPRKMPQMTRQRGAGTIEYLLLTGLMVGALLTPFGEEGKSVQQRLMEAIRDQRKRP
ncbi:hypothetical protein OR573_01185 [Halomonas sp. CH40]